MTTDVTLTIQFHTPFRVGTAFGRDGLDLAVDHDDPLPTTHLKGVLRSTARDLLAIPAADVDAVFGSPAAAAPWAWSRIRPVSGGWTLGDRHRVAIDPATHTAAEDRLVHGERAWTATAVCTVTWLGVPGVHPAPTSRQVLVLRAAAAGTRHVGAWRRRGMGHVTITPDPPLSDADLTALADLTGARA